MKSRLTARSPLLKFSPRELPYKNKFNARRIRETQKKDIDVSLFFSTPSNSSSYLDTNESVGISRVSLPRALRNFSPHPLRPTIDPYRNAYGHFLTAAPLVGDSAYGRADLLHLLLVSVFSLSRSAVAGEETRQSEEAPYYVLTMRKLPDSRHTLGVDRHEDIKTDDTDDDVDEDGDNDDKEHDEGTDDKKLEAGPLDILVHKPPIIIQ